MGDRHMGLDTVLWGQPWISEQMTRNPRDSE